MNPSGLPRVLVCTEAWLPRVAGSVVVLRHLLEETAGRVEYRLLTALPGPSQPGISVRSADLPSPFYRRDFRVGLSDFFRLLSTRLLFGRFLAEARDFRPDLVLSVFPSDRFFLLGHRIAGALGVPNVACFHNLWEEVFAYARAHGGSPADSVRHRLAARSEGGVVRSAALRTAVTPALAAFLEAKHGVPFICIPHGFPPPPDLPPVASPGDGILRLLLPGSIYGMHAGSVGVVLDAIGGRAADTRLTLTTGQDRRYLASLGVREGEGVEIRNQPDEAAFHALMARADGCVVLLSPDGHAPDDLATAFPTRTVEALRFGKPLLCVAPEDSHLFRVVRESGAGIAVAPGSPPAFEAALSRFRDPAVRAALAANAKRLFGERFLVTHPAEAWLAEVNRLVRR